ncbi:DUF4837 family protein [Flavobacteriaceae bacterium]|nr:DUF4837 family protein [Flavobacteriaceae bacterium]
MKKIEVFIVFIALLSLGACSKSDKKNEATLVGSNGRANHVLFVVDNDVWKGRVGEALRTIVGEPVVGLPQDEPLLDYAQVPPHLFGSMMKASRTVIKIDLGEPQEMIVQEDIYARPQIVLTMNAENRDRMLELLRERGGDMIRYVQRQDVGNIQARNRKNQFDSSQLKTLKNLNISLLIPREFAQSKFVDTGDFLWMDQRLTGGIAVGDGSMNFLVYSYPLDEDHPFEPSTVLRMRDEMGEKYIPGTKEGQFMITEKARKPVFYKTTLKGYACIETHSTWEMKNDYMAGPFVNYSILDRDNNRVIVFEGFVYAPSVDKRDYMMELEAIAKSIKINN